MSDTDPAIAAGDNEFIKFVAACEKLVQAPGGPIETRDAVAACLLYTSPSPRDRTRSRMPSSA